jgi:hypothetical protein
MKAINKMPVEIYKTNVREERLANDVIQMLLEHFPTYRINFDLYDCDHILRVEANNIIPETISNLLLNKGFLCEWIPE